MKPSKIADKSKERDVSMSLNSNISDPSPKNISSKRHFKCKVRDNQEVGRWRKSEHEDFLKGK